MPLRRSFLYMPATDWRKIKKAATELRPDSICMDLEDGVALSRKAEARTTAVQALKELDFGSAERLVRINATDTDLAFDDLEAVLPAQPDGIVVPKVRSGNHIQVLHEKLATAEHKYGFPGGSLKLLLIIESARGVILLDEIYKASSRIQALIFGAEDYSADIGAIRSPAGLEVLWARTKVVAYARSIGVDAIDIVYPNFRDPQGFLRQAKEGLGFGYTGKQLIHPDQIDLIHQVYRPAEEEIQKARRIVEAYAAHQAGGTGAFALDGHMVDMPVVRQAKLVLDRAGVNQ